MMDHEFDNRIEEYVEGTLTPDLTERMEAHLAACERCRSAVDLLRCILDETPRLSRSIEPGADLWPAISARIEGEPRVWGGDPGSGPSAPRSRMPRSRAFTLAAAALVLMAIGASWWMSRQTGPGIAPTNPLMVTAGTSLMDEFESTESAYLEAAEVLEASFRLERGMLTNETAEALDRNLEILDSAIDEVRMTVAANPRDPEALDHLAVTYRNKVDVLRRLTRISARDPDLPSRAPASQPDTDSESPRR